MKKNEPHPDKNEYPNWKKLDMKKITLAFIPSAIAALMLAGSVNAQALIPGQSSVPDLPDEISEQIEDRLVKDGVIERQSRIGEDVLILQREGDRIKALESILDKVGLEGFRALYPELAEQIETSPLALKSQIQMVKLINELDEAVNGPKEAAEAAAAEVAKTAAKDGPKGFIEMDIAPAGTIAGSTQMTPKEIEKLREEEREKARAEVEREMAAANRIPPISLREIYGSGSETFAIISIAGEKVRVRAGDSLPGEMLIKTIGADFIEVINNDELVTISIRG